MVSGESPRGAGHGQSLLQYGLIVVLVVLALVGALVLLGPALGDIIQRMTSPL